ncbi:MAG TPA: M20 family metallopeptidase [Baekduia sp.]|uniref:M20 family metallopeptidase n=1 Tax=Baekduia sp. TaxID=2600305 RepID=UPI002D793889|nr:M20 family metallopeptidase [Baekduia sp.]HET6509899.1 M20 family metallopeptidase [Baekduia sp.]
MSARAEDVVELLTRVVRTPSVNPPGAEEAVVGVLQDYLDAHGVTTWRSDVRPGRPNLYAEVGSGAPVVLLNGHLDTVPVGDGWTRDPFGAEIDGGRLYGRGSSDMGGGLVACTVAVALLAARGVALGGTVVLALTADEEVGALGARHAVEVDRLRADAAIVAEPTGMEVYASTNGQLNWTVRLHGRASHSSRPHLGHDALADAWRLHEALRATGRPYLIGQLAAGTAANVVPAECELRIDLRLKPGETVAQAEEELVRLVAEATAGAPRAAEIDVTLAVPPMDPAPDARLADVVAAAFGASAERHHAPYTTDGSWFAAAGIPTVIAGPGDPEQSHTADESIELDMVRRAAEALERAVLDALALISRAELPADRAGCGA